MFLLLISLIEAVILPNRPFQCFLILFLLYTEYKLPSWWFFFIYKLQLNILFDSNDQAVAFSLHNAKAKKDDT